MQTEFTHTFTLWLMWSVAPVIMSSEMPPNAIHIMRAHSLTLKCTSTISAVIGTCVRLNSTLPYLVLATVFDANTEQNQPSKWHQNGGPFPRTMPKIPNMEQLILRVAREVEEQHPNNLIQPWQNGSVASCRTIAICNLALRHTLSGGSDNLDWPVSILSLRTQPNNP